MRKAGKPKEVINPSEVTIYLEAATNSTQKNNIGRLSFTKEINGYTIKIYLYVDKNLSADAKKSHELKMEHLFNYTKILDIHYVPTNDPTNTAFDVKCIKLSNITVSGQYKLLDSPRDCKPQNNNPKKKAKAEKPKKAPAVATAAGTPKKNKNKKQNKNHKGEHIAAVALCYLQLMSFFYAIMKKSGRYANMQKFINAAASLAFLAFLVITMTQWAMATNRQVVGKKEKVDSNKKKLGADKKTKHKPCTEHNTAYSTPRVARQTPLAKLPAQRPNIHNTPDPTSNSEKEDSTLDRKLKEASNELLLKLGLNGKHEIKGEISEEKIAEWNNHRCDMDITVQLTREEPYPYTTLTKMCMPTYELRGFYLISYADIGKHSAKRFQVIDDQNRLWDITVGPGDSVLSSASDTVHHKNDWQTENIKYMIKQFRNKNEKDRKSTTAEWPVQPRHNGKHKKIKPSESIRYSELIRIIQKKPARKQKLVEVILSCNAENQEHRSFYRQLSKDIKEGIKEDIKINDGPVCDFILSDEKTLGLASTAADKIDKNPQKYFKHCCPQTIIDILTRAAEPKQKESAMRIYNKTLASLHETNSQLITECLTPQDEPTPPEHKSMQDSGVCDQLANDLAERYKKQKEEEDAQKPKEAKDAQKHTNEKERPAATESENTLELLAALYKSKKLTSEFLKRHVGIVPVLSIKTRKAPKGGEQGGEQGGETKTKLYGLLNETRKKLRAGAKQETDTKQGGPKQDMGGSTPVFCRAF